VDRRFWMENPYFAIMGGNPLKWMLTLLDCHATNLIQTVLISRNDKIIKPFGLDGSMKSFWTSRLWDTSSSYQERLTHREIFWESCWLKPKSDCIYRFPVDLDPYGSPFGSKSNGKYSLISGWFNKISERFFCV